jgi:hypothetical protein
MKSKPYQTHKHHIIPRHVGGTNDPSNIVELTVPEHAEAHRKLYEEYGRWQDKVAWEVLSGQMTIPEAQLEAKRKAVGDFHRGRKCTPEHKEKTRQSMLGKNKGKPSPMKGRNHSPESREKMRKSAMGNKNAAGHTLTHTDETKEKIRQASLKAWETRSRKGLFGKTPKA